MCDLWCRTHVSGRHTQHTQWWAEPADSGTSIMHTKPQAQSEWSLVMSLQSTPNHFIIGLNWMSFIHLSINIPSNALVICMRNEERTDASLHICVKVLNERNFNLIKNIIINTEGLLIQSRWLLSDFFFFTRKSHAIDVVAMRKTHEKKKCEHWAEQ